MKRTSIRSRRSPSPLAKRITSFIQGLNKILTIASKDYPRAAALAKAIHYSEVDCYLPIIADKLTREIQPGSNQERLLWTLLLRTAVDKLHSEFLPLISTKDDREIVRKHFT